MEYEILSIVIVTRLKHIVKIIISKTKTYLKKDHRYHHKFAILTDNALINIIGFL